MLYHLYELQHATISPLRMAADASKKWLRNPANPMSTPIRAGPQPQHVTCSPILPIVTANRNLVWTPQ